MKQDPIFGDVEIYRDDVRIHLPVALPRGAKEVTLLAGSQGCSDIGICYLPQLQELEVSMTGSPGSSPSSILDRPRARANFSAPAASSLARPEADILKSLPPLDDSKEKRP
jgi:thiol:disulfide interchange protein DsbD